MVIVCLLPEFLRKDLGASFYFGGTSLLIVVVVVMDFISQIQAHLMSHQYESLLKKANLKGGARRSEEHTSELQSLMRISYAVFCLNKNKTTNLQTNPITSP